jgi:hypothetical protein
MPILRMPTDTTLGDTLGNLGRSLTEGFNPLNQLRAYDIQQQMWMRQQQLLQLQRENQARQAAIDQWSHIVPADKLPQIALMIYQGAPYDQIARSAAQLSGNLKDDPNAMQENIRYIEQITGKPYDYASLGPPVAGPNTAKVYDDWKVNQAGKSAASTALGTKTGEQTATANLANGLIDDTTPEATQNNIKIMETMTGKPWDNPYPPAVGPKTTQAFNDWKVKNAQDTAAATATGTNTADNATKPRDLAKPQLFPPPGGFNNGPAAPAQPAQPPAPSSNGPTPPAQPTLPAPATNPPNVSVPNTAAPFAPPAPVVRQTPVGTIVGQTPTETAASTSVSDANLKDLTQALTEAQSAKQLLPKLDQLHDLVHLYNAAGPTGQLDAGAVKLIADKWGMSIGDKGAAYQAIQQLLNSEIPDIRQKAGIQRLAGPAIKEEQLIIGNPNMPPKVMDNIIANEKAAADIQVERGNIAFKARYGQGQAALPMPDYAQQSFDLDNTIQQRTDDYRKQYGAVGTESQQPATITTPPPMLSSNPFSDAISAVARLFGGGGGAQAQPPQPPPTQTPPTPDAAPPQQFQFDPKTNSIVPVQ